MRNMEPFIAVLTYGEEEHKLESMKYDTLRKILGFALAGITDHWTLQIVDEDDHAIVNYDTKADIALITDFDRRLGEDWVKYERYLHQEQLNDPEYCRANGIDYPPLDTPSLDTSFHDNEMNVGD